MAGGSRFAGNIEFDDSTKVKESGALGWSGAGDLSARSRTMGATSVDKGCYIEEICSIRGFPSTSEDTYEFRYISNPAIQVALAICFPTIRINSENVYRPLS